MYDDLYIYTPLSIHIHIHTYTYPHTLTILGHPSQPPDGDKSLGMVIVSGKARSARGNVLEGVFVQKILPGSPADRDGR